MFSGLYTFTVIYLGPGFSFRKYHFKGKFKLPFLFNWIVYWLHTISIFIPRQTSKMEIFIKIVNAGKRWSSEYVSRMYKLSTAFERSLKTEKTTDGHIFLIPKK